MTTFQFVGIDYTGLPKGLRGGTQRWIEAGIQPGSFLSAVIANNLKKALGHADASNQVAIFQIVSWFYNEAPGPCWGSVAAARKWASQYECAFEPEWREEGAP